jgi:hypothetical protein
MKLTAVVLTVAILALVGCGGSSTQQALAPLNLTGNWQFSAHSNLGLTFTGAAALQQTGSSVTGQVTLSGDPCALSAALVGTVTGSAFNFQLQEGSQSVAFTGTISGSGTGVSGTYSAPSGGCTQGDIGTWSAIKQ